MLGRFMCVQHKTCMNATRGIAKIFRRQVESEKVKMDYVLHCKSADGCVVYLCTPKNCERTLMHHMVKSYRVNCHLAENIFI